MQDTES